MHRLGERVYVIYDVSLNKINQSIKSAIGYAIIFLINPAHSNTLLLLPRNFRHRRVSVWLVLGKEGPSLVRCNHRKGFVKEERPLLFTGNEGFSLSDMSDHRMQ